MFSFRIWVSSFSTHVLLPVSESVLFFVFVPFRNCFVAVQDTRIQEYKNCCREKEPLTIINLLVKRVDDKKETPPMITLNMCDVKGYLIWYFSSNSMAPLKARSLVFDDKPDNTAGMALILHEFYLQERLLFASEANCKECLTGLLHQGFSSGLSSTQRVIG